MANLQLRKAFTEKFTPLPLGTDVDGMTMVFAESMLSTAANIAPRAKRSQDRRGGVLTGGYFTSVAVWLQTATVGD